MVKVKLKGLNIVRARGKYYVYHRDSGEALLKGFEGNHADLERRLAEPDLIAAYNRLRTRDLKRTYPEGTLGALVQWFEECPEFNRLADATKQDYRAALTYLREEFDAPLTSITQPALYEVRDRCATKKWPRFADKMISALSSMFSQAMKRGKMQTNPAMGIDKVHKADKNANREWLSEEWIAATANAPREILIPLMLARHCGFRGQTVASVQWKNYQPDPRFGKCFRHIAKKNAEQSYVPLFPEMQTFLDGLDRTSLNIATRTDGTPWASEKDMQTAVSHYLRRLEKVGLIGAGTTLHGLRTSFAAERRRDGESDSDVAAALGDRSERMGKHYTRHVENEVRVIRAFEGKKKP